MLASVSSAPPGGFIWLQLHRGLKPTATIARPCGRRSAPIKHDPCHLRRTGHPLFLLINFNCSTLKDGIRRLAWTLR